MQPIFLSHSAITAQNVSNHNNAIQELNDRVGRMDYNYNYYYYMHLPVHTKCLTACPADRMTEILLRIFIIFHVQCLH